MAKICILEDDESDVINKYSELTRTAHDIHLVLDKEMIYSLPLRQVINNNLIERLNSEFFKAGFNLENISYGFKNIPEDASLYFCDGLNGECIRLAEELGKGRVYINTEDIGLQEKAREGGFIILDKPVKDIVDKLK